MFTLRREFHSEKVLVKKMALKKFNFGNNQSIVSIGFFFCYFLLAHLSRRLSVSFSDPLLSVVCPLSVVCQHLPCEHDTGHIMHPIIMKICQNVCLDKISVKN